MVTLVKMQPDVIASFSPMPDGNSAAVTRYLNLSPPMSFAITTLVCLVIGSLHGWKLFARQPARLNPAVR